MKNNTARGSGWSPLVDAEAFFPAFPRPEGDLRGDAVVIGGGLSGTLAAYELTQSGKRVILLAGDTVGSGAVRWSAGICTGDGGADLRQLIPQIGQENAVAWYRACAEAVPRLESIVKQVGSRCAFRRRDVFYYTQTDAEAIKEECRLRYHIGLPCRRIDGDGCAEQYSFSVREGFLTSQGGAEFQPSRFCRDLAAYLSLHGTTVLEGARVDSVQVGDHGEYTCLCGNARITAPTVVDARGGETLRRRPRLGRRMTVFCAVTQPVTSFFGWKDRNILKQFDAFSFLRTTPDNRILFCGMPSLHRFPEGSRVFPTDALIRARYQAMTEEIRERFVGIPHVRRDGGFCQEMIRTPTGLPYIGRDTEWSGWYYLYAFGEAGIAAAVYGANRIAALCDDKNAKFPLYLAI